MIYRFLQRSIISILFIVLCLSTLCVHRSYANSDRKITTAQWQQLTSDKAFNYKQQKEKVVQPKEYKPSAFEKFLHGFTRFFQSNTWNTLSWLAAIGLVIFILYKLFFSKNSILFGKDKKLMTDDSQQENIEDITATNWEALLQHAANNNDLRMAVRYSYMWLLQMLQQHQLIQYKTDKTNYEYYLELQDSSYKQPFKQLSRQYEYAWYGQYTLSPAMYHEYLGLFNQVKNQLGA
jgi:hypothetical protein